MPMYEFQCTFCPSRREERMTLRARKEEEARADRGEAQVFCPDCGSAMAYAFSPSAIATLQGFGWASRDHLEAVARERRAASVSRKQRDHRRAPTLTPNLGGKLADRWADVRDEVRDKSGEKAAATYDKVVAAEG